MKDMHSLLLHSRLSVFANVKRSSSRRRRWRTALPLGVVGLVVWLASGTQAQPDGKDVQAERIAALEKTLTNAVLVGRFTVTGEDQKQPQAERYELKAVRHLGNQQWLFETRIQYGDVDLTLPLTLPIRWAGDTPVITVDNLPIVGLGAFTARVMIYRDHYAGFWTGKDHGGHLFGIVERKKDAKQDVEAKQAESGS